MDRNEKLLLLELILRDIRGWRRNVSSVNNADDGKIETNQTAA
jgi:hypothetical protein